jgi:glycosyltransferase involved in cell wall biosynthesis
VPPRVFLSRALLEEGKDLTAAERTLRDLAGRAPGLAEGWRNLSLLLSEEATSKFAEPNGQTASPTPVQGQPTFALPPRKCLRLAFASYFPFPFQVDTPYQQPLGGSESALCYLAEALAEAGHELFVLTSAGETGISRGVPCLPLQPETFKRLPALDALIVQNLAGQGGVLREAVGPKTSLILWTGHGPDQPGVRALTDPAERNAYDAFVLVSAWQRQRYLDVFSLDSARTFILPNAIAPAFQNLFADGESIVAAKEQPPVLSYTSTPDRGLGLLLDGFPRVREAFPEARLDVYSSLRLYGFSDAADQAQYGALYDRCRTTPGVVHVGVLPQPELAQRLRRTAVLAYANRVPETFGISVLEAMAAGCTVVTSALGALPETTAGFARLVPLLGDPKLYVDRFVEQTVAALRDLNSQEERLRQQVAKVNRDSTWAIVARRWIEWLGQ